MTHKITIEEAKQSLGKGKGTGKKGWFGSQARTTVAPKLNGAKLSPRPAPPSAASAL